jgi:hypothetical protein
MPRKMRTPKERYELSSGQIAQLCHGRDYFRDGFGIPGDEDAMRNAWRANREQIEQYCREYWPGSVPYARLRFDEGLSHHKALEGRNWPPKKEQPCREN